MNFSNVGSRALDATYSEDVVFDRMDMETPSGCLLRNFKMCVPITETNFFSPSVSMVRIRKLGLAFRRTRERLNYQKLEERNRMFGT